MKHTETDIPKEAASMSEAFEWAPYAQYQKMKPRDEIKTMTELYQYGYGDSTSEIIDPITGLCPNNFVPDFPQNYWRWWTREFSETLYDSLVTLYRYCRRIEPIYDTDGVSDMLCAFISDFECCALDNEEIIDEFSELI